MHVVDADGTLKLPSGKVVKLAGLKPSEVGAAFVKADNPKFWPKAEEFRVRILGR